MQCVVAALDELAADMSQVSMGESTLTRTHEEEASSEEVEGACGGSHQGDATTLILAECLGAEVTKWNSHII